jgi:uroporphyrinogen decarboxylase
MGSRERIHRIIAKQPADGAGFWLGNPHPETWPRYLAYFGASDGEEVRRALGDDLRWICPQFFASTYQHPDGRGLFDAGPRTSHGQAGPLAGCDDPGALDAFDWPNADYLDFGETVAALEAVGDFYRASGFWTSFYHDLIALFGMEAYLMKMYTKPEVIHAATERVCGFYYEANERFFEAAGDRIDAFFFGNDFGTQSGLICSPEQFDEFIMPWFRRFAEQGHAHGLQVMLHSCGAIHDVIERLIGAGVDCLHPLQALAQDMDAATLAHDFGGRIAFLGGIDTQRLLVEGTPGEVESDVRRVRELLGPHVIISPSHEALLPNVPPENVEAMARAAKA